MKFIEINFEIIDHCWVMTEEKGGIITLTSDQNNIHVLWQYDIMGVSMMNNRILIRFIDSSIELHYGKRFKESKDEVFTRLVKIVKENNK